jgi:phosphoglycolate phosphatase-like HAD superfamily hydrolase
MYGAKNFGCGSIAALWGGHSSREVLMGVGANYAAEQPLECFSIIENHL